MNLVRFCMMMFIGMAMVTGVCHAEDFSADIVSSMPQGTFMSKIYVSQDKSRTEVEGTATIARMDKKVVWVIIPAQRMYMEQPLDMQSAASTQEKIEGEISRTMEGRETVSGISAAKYRVTYESQGQRNSIFQWIDERRHFPVKTAAIDGSWSSEFRNIKTGPQDPALFEVPAGYKKFAMPTMNDVQAMMGNAGGGE